MTDAPALAAASGWPEGVARHILPEVDSTNAEALRLGARLSGPAWIMARRQTAGRGRRGRAWTDPPGNFAASLLLHPDAPAEAAARTSFAAALAVHDALSLACGPAARLALKWPNDVLLNGGKVAGILLESSGTGGRVQTLVVGIGINLLAAPPAAAVEPGALPPVSVAAETGHRLTPEEMLDLLAPAMAQRPQDLASASMAPMPATNWRPSARST